jgi:hypothetical protein
MGMTALWIAEIPINEPEPDGDREAQARLALDHGSLVDIAKLGNFIGAFGCDGAEASPISRAAPDMRRVFKDCNVWVSKIRA